MVVVVVVTACPSRYTVDCDTDYNHSKQRIEVCETHTALPVSRDDNKERLPITLLTPPGPPLLDDDEQLNDCMPPPPPPILLNELHMGAKHQSRK